MSTSALQRNPQPTWLARVSQKNFDRAYARSTHERTANSHQSRTVCGSWGTGQFPQAMFIGGIEFDLSARVGVYPETITLDAGAGVVLEVTLDWAP